jgi:hypothetical protein
MFAKYARMRLEIERPHQAMHAARTLDVEPCKEISPYRTNDVVLGFGAYDD